MNVKNNNLEKIFTKQTGVVLLIFWLIATIAVTLYLVGYFGSSDEDMIKHFKANKEQFNVIASKACYGIDMNEKYKVSELCLTISSDLKFKSVHPLGGGGVRISSNMSKGYSFLTKPPSKIYENLDVLPDDVKSYEYGYKLIEGNWYLWRVNSCC